MGTFLIVHFCAYMRGLPGRLAFTYTLKIIPLVSTQKQQRVPQKIITIDDTVATHYASVALNRFWSTLLPLRINLNRVGSLAGNVVMFQHKRTRWWTELLYLAGTLQLVGVKQGRTKDILWAFFSEPCLCMFQPEWAKPAGLFWATPLPQQSI